jgi:hypothetical protein
LSSASLTTTNTLRYSAVTGSLVTGRAGARSALASGLGKPAPWPGACGTGGGAMRSVALGPELSAALGPELSAALGGAVGFGSSLMDGSPSAGAGPT